MAVLVLCCLISCLVGLYRVQTANFETAQPVLHSLKNDSLHIVKFIGLALPFLFYYFCFFHAYLHFGKFRYQLIKRSLD